MNLKGASLNLLLPSCGEQCFSSHYHLSYLYPSSPLPQDSPLPVIQRLRAGKEFVQCLHCEAGRFRLLHFCRAGRHPILPLDTSFTHGCKLSIFSLIISLVLSFLLISLRPSPPLEPFTNLNEASSSSSDPRFTPRTFSTSQQDILSLYNRKSCVDKREVHGEWNSFVIFAFLHGLLQGGPAVVSHSPETTPSPFNFVENQSSYSGNLTLECTGPCLDLLTSNGSL